MDNNSLSFIGTVQSAILIQDTLELIECLYDKTCVKCINLCIPHNDCANIDIITREMKFTQDYIYDFITSCSYELSKETIKALKKRTRERKYEATKRLYKLFGCKGV